MGLITLVYATSLKVFLSLFLKSLLSGGDRGENCHSPT